MEKNYKDIIFLPCVSCIAAWRGLDSNLTGAHALAFFVFSIHDALTFQSLVKKWRSAFENQNLMKNNINECHKK